MRLTCLILLWLMAAIFAPAQAQTTAPTHASLSADRIVYTSGYRVLRASGNVVILYGAARLEAAAITYDQHNDRITAEGPIRLTEGENLTMLADFAELSGDMRNGVLRSARMVLNQQLQLTAVEINRSDGRYNRLIKAAASTCSISTAHPTPFWQVRARRIVHDEDKKVLFFERAQLRLGNVPVAYIPRLRLPDPSVRRANGFLVPAIGNSSRLGTGISAPYFLMLGDYADVTLTPHIYSQGTATLGVDLRKRFHNGRLDIEGAVSNDTQAANPIRAYVFADGAFHWANGLTGELHLELVSDNTYLSDHGISSATRLESHLRLSRTTRQTRFTVGAEGFRSLTTAVMSDEIPFLLGEAGLQKRWRPGSLGGQMGFSLAANSYNRSSSTDIVGRDTIRVSSVADWHRQWTGRRGLIFTTSAELHADYYSVSQDSTYPAPVARVVPIAAADVRLPMVRRTARATEVIEPRLQIVWSPDSSTAVPDEDSPLVEFEATNLFALNRFAGIDQIEQGLRANVGVSYSRKSTKGWNIDAVIGGVVRATDLGQFTPASGLGGTMSSYVLAGQVILPSQFKLAQRTVFDSSFAVSKNETRIAYKNQRFDAGTSYLWLVTGAAGNVADRSEWTFDGGVNMGQNWRTETSWRYDTIAGTASDAALSLIYRNECIMVDLSVSRRFAAISNVGDATNLGLQVTLEGFGARADSDAYSRQCNEF